MSGVRKRSKRETSANIMELPRERIGTRQPGALTPEVKANIGRKRKGEKKTNQNSQRAKETEATEFSETESFQDIISSSITTIQTVQFTGILCVQVWFLIVLLLYKLVRIQIRSVSSTMPEHSQYTSLPPIGTVFGETLTPQDSTSRVASPAVVVPEEVLMEVPQSYQQRQQEQTRASVGAFGLGSTGDEGIQSRPVRFVAAMPYGQDMAYFTGQNITLFLERYKQQCTNNFILPETMVEQLPLSCEATIGVNIRGFQEWEDRDWDALREALLAEYREEDSEQQMMTTGFLETLRDRGCQGMSVRVYSRQFRLVSTALVKRGLISGYTQCVWYLKGLPQSLREKIVRKHNMDIDRPATMDFMLALKAVANQDAAERTNENLGGGKRQAEVWKEIVGAVEKKTTVPRGNILAPPVRTDTSRNSATEQAWEKRMDSLTSQFEVMAMAMKLSVGGEGFGQQQNARGQAVQNVQINAANQMATVQSGQSQQGCFYCGGQHSERFCQLKQEDINKQFIHLDIDNRICPGPAPTSGQPRKQSLYLHRNGPKRPQIIAEFERQKGALPTVSPMVNGIHLLVGSTAVSEVDLDATAEVYGDELEYSDWDEDGSVVWGQVGAARLDSKKSSTSTNYQDKHRVLKNRLEKEKKMPSMKHMRAGNYERAMVSEELDREQDVEMVDKPIKQLERFQNDFQSSAMPVARTISGSRLPRPKRLVDELKDTADPKALLDKIMDQKLDGITVREVFANSPALLRMAFRSMEQPVAAVVSDSIAVAAEGKGKAKAPKVSAYQLSQQVERDYYCLGTPKAKVRINDESVVLAMWDSGAEINVMIRSVAEQAGLVLSPSPDMSLVAVGGGRQGFVGICEEVPVQFGHIVQEAAFFVVEDGEIPLILGQPYMHSVGATVGGGYICVPDPRTGAITRVKGVRDSDPANRTRQDLFPLN